MSISNNEIDILYSFFDQIIPSSDDMPCATEAIDKKDFEILISENSKYELSIDQIIYFIKREPTSRVGGGASSLTEIQKGEILELMESIIPEARDVASLSEPLAALSYLPMLRPQISLKSHRFEGVDSLKSGKCT